MNTAVAMSLLQEGQIELEGLLPWSSNYSFLARIIPTAVDPTIDPTTPNELLAVYKPQKGERPLWDFPQGTLYQRERAAFLISQALGWHQVPPTAIRQGPHGIGSVQLFIPHDPDCHYFTIEADPTFADQLQKIVLFDTLINNADRKAGHVLIEEREPAQSPARLWLIDHGICFHNEPKLRTVIWEFAGQAIPQPLLADLQQLQQALATPTTAVASELAQLLSPIEQTALHKRMQTILNEGIFILPGAGRHYPWPPV